MELAARQAPDERVDSAMSEAVANLIEGDPTLINYLAMDIASHQNWDKALEMQGMTFERHKSAQVMTADQALKFFPALR
jgi:hypothetical protein